MDLGGSDIDFAELPCGKWEWDSEEELRADWNALMLYVEDREAESYFITKAWGAWDSDDSNDDEWGYEVIWDSKDDDGNFDPLK
jgi:hypothetical protein